MASPHGCQVPEFIRQLCLPGVTKDLASGPSSTGCHVWAIWGGASETRLEMSRSWSRSGPKMIYTVLYIYILTLYTLYIYIYIYTSTIQFQWLVDRQDIFREVYKPPLGWCWFLEDCHCFDGSGTFRVTVHYDSSQICRGRSDRTLSLRPEATQSRRPCIFTRLVSDPVPY